MSKNQEYIQQYAEYAMEQMRRYGIPASVTLAQGICESASGQSELSRKGNNHFGIKATSSWIENGGKYLVYTDDRPNEKFCQYANVGDSYEHHSQFLKRNGRYAGLFQLSPDDYKGWTNGLQDAGYTVSGGVNAPYIWLKTPDQMTSWEFFDYLLENANVVGTPGSGFGPSGEGYFRLTAFGNYENTVKALERIKAL